LDVSGSFALQSWAASVPEKGRLAKGDSHVEATSVLLEAIRSLHGAFRVVLRDPQRLELAMSSLVLGGVEGSYVISFASPRGAWAMEWDSAKAAWIERPGLSEPISGSIAEAFVKEIPGGYAVSFSDRSSPLVRWGFTADAISIRAPV
jgi:hypothetical protein